MTALRAKQQLGNIKRILERVQNMSHLDDTNKRQLSLDARNALAQFDQVVRLLEKMNGEAHPKGG
jgi:hypothetical protein